MNSVVQLTDSNTLDRAFEYKRRHPNASCKEVADQKNDLLQALERDSCLPGVNTHRNLSDKQVRVLIKKIVSYAERGTLLSSRHVHKLAEAVFDGKLGVNRASNLV